MKQEMKNKIKIRKFTIVLCVLLLASLGLIFATLLTGISQSFKDIFLGVGSGLLASTIVSLVFDFEIRLERKNNILKFRQSFMEPLKTNIQRTICVFGLDLDLKNLTSKALCIKMLEKMKNTKTNEEEFAEQKGIMMNLSNKCEDIKKSLEMFGNQVDFLEFNNILTLEELRLLTRSKNYYDKAMDEFVARVILENLIKVLTTFPELN